MFLTSLLLLALASDFQNPNSQFPNLVGGSGVLHSYSALPNPNNTFGANFVGGFFTDPDFIQSQKQSRVRIRLDGNYTYNLYNFPVEFFSGFQLTYNENSNTAQSRTATTYFENFDFGLKVPYTIYPNRWTVAGYGYAQILSGTSSPRNSSGITSSSFGPFMSGEFGGISTYEFNQIPHIPFPIRQHFNLGIRFPNSNTVSDDLTKFSLDAYKYEALVLNLSAEAVFHFIKPFLEYSFEYALFTGHDPVKFSQNREKFSLGFRINPIPTLAILTAVDFGIAGPSEGDPVGIPLNPAFDLFFGISYQGTPSGAGASALGESTERTPAPEKKISKGGTIAGSVTDKATGMPLQDVAVTIAGETYPPQNTNAAGSFEFREIPEGPYQIHFDKVGYAPEIRSVGVRGDERVVVEVRMESAESKLGGFDLRIVDMVSQAPVPQAAVTIDGIAETSASTDANGAVQFPQLSEGNHRIHVEAPGYQASDWSLPITAGQMKIQALALPRAVPQDGFCSGSVKNKQGMGLTAVLTSDAQSANPYGTDPLSGAFEIKLAPGTYHFIVQAENYLPQSVDCEVKPGEKTNLDIVLQKPEQATVVNDKILLPDAIYFDSKSAKIPGKSLKVLDQVAKILRSPKTKYSKLRIEGHTDDREAGANAEKLSLKRAEAVRAYLVRKGVPKAKLVTKGFGKSKPIATNLVEEGRAENRRVEFEFLGTSKGR